MASHKDQALKPQITFGKFQNVDLRVARVVSAPMAEGTTSPCRVITLDVGHLGTRTSVGQYALISEEDLVGTNVIVCVNLSPREMGAYTSEALILGAPNPDSPHDQNQAIPLTVSQAASCGDPIF